MLHREAVDVCYYCHMEHASTVCERNAGIIIIKTIEAYVNNLLYFDVLCTELALSFCAMFRRISRN